MDVGMFISLDFSNAMLYLLPHQSTPDYIVLNIKQLYRDQFDHNQKTTTKLKLHLNLSNRRMNLTKSLKSILLKIHHTKIPLIKWLETKILPFATCPKHLPSMSSSAKEA